ncbi:initiation factor 2 subunit family domain-containing protein [Ditylenchus destructor]|nr:initiation factor 2 subunit family domain-containing protein [Ditylenchus destructor]
MIPNNTSGNSRHSSFSINERSKSVKALLPLNIDYPVDVAEQPKASRPFGKVTNFGETNQGWLSVAHEELELHSHIFDQEKFTLKILDQLLLPHITEYVDVESVEDAYQVIKKMQVRGAPLIATVGMLGLIVDLRHRVHNLHVMSTAEFLEFVTEKCDMLVSARPTAINLANIIGELKQLLRVLFDEFGAEVLKIEDDGNRNEESEAAERKDRVLTIRSKIESFVLDWQAKEREENNLLIRNSVTALTHAVPSKKLVVLTICNTGSLATSSYGTALGVIVHLHKLGHLQTALALETRPYNQGSRLTTYELSAYKVPHLLMADSMAAYAMKTYKIDAVLVGADQVALNGDTANKIGTYMLSVLAAYHRIPFYVVTPTSSINPRITTGSEIRVEERPQIELIRFNGALTAPADCPVWNPAFDVTPAALITAILTEKGNFEPENLPNAFLETQNPDFI